MTSESAYRSLPPSQRCRSQGCHGCLPWVLGGLRRTQLAAMPSTTDMQYSGRSTTLQASPPATYPPTFSSVTESRPYCTGCHATLSTLRSQLPNAYHEHRDYLKSSRPRSSTAHSLAWSNFLSLQSLLSTRSDLTVGLNNTYDLAHNS